MSLDGREGGAVAHRPSDMRAGFIGLVVGAIALLGIVYGIVRWTDSRFEGHDAAPAATTPY